MARRRANGRSIKSHRNYSVDDAARTLNVAKGTIRRWLKTGLPRLTDGKPYLILGADLIDFLKGRTQPKQKCSLTQCYCFSCRKPRGPAGRMADITIRFGTKASYSVLCEDCGTVMHKQVSVAAIPAFQAVLDVSIRQAGERINNQL